MTKEQELFEEMKALGKDFNNLKKTTLKMVDDLEKEKEIFQKEKIHNAIIENSNDLNALEEAINKIKNELKA